MTMAAAAGTRDQGAETPITEQEARALTAVFVRDLARGRMPAAQDVEDALARIRRRR